MMMSTKGDSPSSVWRLAWLDDWIASTDVDLALIFGSCVIDPKSARDIDLLIVGNTFRNIHFQDRRRLFSAPETSRFLDLFCYTLEEFRCLFPGNHPFLRSIMKKHIVIKGDPSVLCRSP